MSKIDRARIFNEIEQNSSPYFAIYENEGKKILISEDEIFLEYQSIVVRYSDIRQATCLVDDNVLLDGVMLLMKDGSRIKIDISGHDGNNYDAHSFVRFMMRTLEDKSSISN